MLLNGQNMQPWTDQQTFNQSCRTCTTLTLCSLMRYINGLIMKLNVVLKKLISYYLIFFLDVEVTFDVALVVMLLQQAAVVGQLLVFVRLS